jgi:hypothetical protein
MALITSTWTCTVAWSSIYMQCSSFNFLMSGLFGDILCLRLFLSWAYLWLFINAVTGFPKFGDFFARDKHFILHIDVLIWSTVTLYVHSSKLISLLRNEHKVTNLPPESLPLWRMLYRNWGLSELLFQQYVWPKFELVQYKKGDTIPDNDDSMYIVLEGVASAKIHVKNKSNERNILLRSGEVIHVEFLHSFRQAKACEVFPEQTIHAVCVSDEMKLYKCRAVDMLEIARQPQTKQAYQGLLIFVLTRIAERAVLQKQDHGQDGETNDNDSTHQHNQRNPAFFELEAWEEPDPLISGSGKALTVPVQHVIASLRKSYRPPWPFSRWIPGLRHAALSAPYHDDLADGSVSEPP